MTTPYSIRGIRPAGSILDEAARVPSPAATQAAADLTAIREQWGDLLAAIGQRPAPVWPPRETRSFLDQAADEPADPIGRMPLVLREHPAPANLDALDAAMRIEEALFEACDAIAERVQRPVRRHLVGRRAADATYVRWAEDQADRADPARWTLPTHRDTGPAAASSPGSRAHGLHWAAMWLEGRALDEPHGDLFTTTPGPVAEQLADVARRARRILDRALNRDGRPTALDRPCPYCRGPLTAHTRSGDPSAATVVCSTGSACTAPVLLDRGRRTWAGAELVTLYVAMVAAEQREE